MALREDPPVLASQARLTVPDVEPLAPPVTRSQVAPVDAVQLQAAPVVSEMVADPAAEVTLAPVTESEGEQANVAVMVCAALITMVPSPAAPPVQPVKM